MKALLIGFGSIGRRHHEVLKSFLKAEDIHVVTKQTIQDITTFSALENVSDIQEYDYFLITSETRKHFEQLCWLNSKVKNKMIFCEKPLFEKSNQVPDLKNEVFVGYVLRFHPLLQKMKELLAGHKVLSSNVTCGSYLPGWRTNIDYRDSYSAKKAEGGGVLLDLSHELDYINWLFGKLVEIKSFQSKISDLQIDSDDFVSMIGKTDQGVMVTLSLDYFSKASHRTIRINTNQFTLEADLVSGILSKTNLDGAKESFSFAGQRNDLFQSMHYEILYSEKKSNVCTLSQGLDVMQSINRIQDQNHE